MILLDANIFMYAAGEAHPNKAGSITLLERVVRGDIEAAADVEVLQEVLHRYRSIGRWADGRRVYDLARQIVSTWVSIDVATLDRARGLLEDDKSLSARDALHAAVYFEEGATAFYSFDKDFDRVPGLHRIEPTP